MKQRAGFLEKINRMDSLVAQTLKRLSTVQETRVRSLGQEDSPREGNGNPLQYSCLENSMDGGAWWAIVHGVTESTEQLHFNFQTELINL